jgi:hypothetical protein
MEPIFLTDFHFFLKEISLFFLGKIKIYWKNDVSKLALTLYYTKHFSIISYAFFYHTLVNCSCPASL